MQNGIFSRKTNQRNRTTSSRRRQSNNSISKVGKFHFFGDWELENGGVGLGERGRGIRGEGARNERVE